MDCSQKSTIFVKVGRVGQKITEYAVESGSTGHKIIEMAGLFPLKDFEVISLSGMDVTSPDSPVKNGDIILIRQKTTVKVRVARIKEILMEVSVPLGATVERALIAAGRLPFNNEDIWSHFDSQEGKIVNLNDIVLNGEILIIEPKRDLRSRIRKVLSNCYNDEGEEFEDAINDLCEMLKRDYNIQ